MEHTKKQCPYCLRWVWIEEESAPAPRSWSAEMVCRRMFALCVVLALGYCAVKLIEIVLT